MCFKNVIARLTFISCLVALNSFAGSFGRTQGQFAVSATGAAQYSIPIWAPPGPRGIQPHMSLTYNSQSGIGPLGVGWSLAGLGSITRCNKTTAQDTTPASVALVASDAYCINGNRLRLTGGTYGADSSTYQTEIADFSNITAVGSAGGNGPASFTVQGRNGLIYQYGVTDSNGNGANSQVLASGTSTALQWALSKVSDRSGNNLVINYTALTGTVVPHNILWTPTSVGAPTYTYTMQFNYVANVPQSSPFGYVAGTPISNNQLLSSIEILSGTTVIRDYFLGYQISPLSGREELNSIQECADSAKANCLLATSVGYQTGSPGVSTVATTAPSSGGIYAARYDFDGDGIPDLVYSNGTTWFVAFGSPSGYGTPINTGITGGPPVLFGNLTGGRQDGMLKVVSGTWFYYLWNGSSFVGTSTGLAYDSTSKNWQLADVNGDGLPDLVSQKDTSTMFNGHNILTSVISFQLNTSTASAARFSATLTTGYTNIGSLSVFLQGPDAQWGKLRRYDFNGDGRDDLVLQIETSTLKTYELLSTGTGFTLSSAISTVTTNFSTAIPVFFTNWNDDKCTDFVTSNTLYISSCNGAAAQTYPMQGTILVGLDWDGDGRTDILVQNGATIGVYLSPGTSALAPTLTSTSVPFSSSCLYLWMDGNGDGLDDLGCQSGTSPSTLSYFLHNGTSDLATSFADGYGNSQSPTYVPMTASGGIYTAGTNATFPTANYNEPLYIVSSYSATDGIGGAYTCSYFYINAVTDLQGRGFEGFNIVQHLDSRNGVWQTLSFNQKFPQIGRQASDDTSQDQARSRPIRSSFVNQTFMTLDATANNQRYFPYNNVAVTHQYEVGGALNGSLISTSNTNYAFDSNGNATNISTTITDNDPNSPYVNDTWTTTTANTIGIAPITDWCLNLPTLTTVTNSSTAPGGAAIIRTVQYNNPDYANCRETEKVTEPTANGGAYKVTEDYGYDPVSGNLLTDAVTGAGMAARTTTIAWGTTGQFPTSIKNPLLQTTQTNFDPNTGKLISSTDPNNITTSWQYDAFARKILENRPDGTSTTWAYNNCATAGCVNGNNRMTVVQTNLQVGGAALNAQNIYLDALGRLLVTSKQMLNGAYDRNEVQYDPLGRVHLQGMPCTFISCVQYWTTNTYDMLNRLTESQRPISANNSTLQNTFYSYQGRTTTVTDPQSKVTTQTTLVTGATARSKDHNGYYVNFNHDSFGALLSVTDSLSNTLQTMTYAYGLQAFRTSLVDMDLGSRSYSPDALGELVSYSDGKGQSFSATFDGLSRTTSRTEPDLTTTWTWGVTATSFNIGKVASATSVSPAGGTHTDSYTYDRTGRLSAHTIVNPTDGSRTFDYAYDTATGLLKSLFYPLSYPSTSRVEVGYSYQNGVLQQVVDLATSTVWWQANSTNVRGQITQETVQALSSDPQIVTAHTYDAVTGWLGSIQSGVSGGSTLQNNAYLYDEMGNVTQRQNNNLGLTENFFYDNLYRLDHSTLGGVTNLQMGYDATGNITSKSDVAGGATWTYDPVRKHAVTQAGSSAFTYAYDSNGNVNSRNGSIIGWTSYNYPSGVTTATESATFDYGPDRQRWRMVYTGPNGTETTYYATPMFEVVHTSSGTDFRHYIFIGGRAVMQLSRSVLGASQRPLLTDHQGSISSIMHGTGTSFVDESFTAFGNRREASTWSGTPTSTELANMNGITRQGYTFQTVLGTMGLNHMNGRIEDSITGRFLSSDPYIPDPTNSQSYNRYAYVNNNPLSYIDPTGFDETCGSVEEHPSLGYCNSGGLGLVDFSGSGGGGSGGGGSGDDQQSDDTDQDPNSVTVSACGGVGVECGDPYNYDYLQSPGVNASPNLPFAGPSIIVAAERPQSPNPCPGANGPASAFRDSAPNNPALGYTPNNVLPSNAQQVTTPDGTVFYAPPNADFAAVYTYGTSLASIPSPLNTGGLQYASGFGGLFDFQRGNNQFNNNYAYASNYAIGILANGANVSLPYVQFVAALVKAVSGGQGFSGASDARAQGYLAAQSGACRHP